MGNLSSDGAVYEFACFFCVIPSTIPAMRKILLRSAAVAGCFVILILSWIFGGEKISLFVDRFKTIPIASLPVSPLIFEELGMPGSLQIGSLPMSTGMPNYKRFPLQLTANASQHLVLLSHGKSFALGPIAPGGTTSGSGIAFLPEDSDKVSFVTERSLLSWLTPFDFNFMTGQSPSWKRHLYYRLTWIKPSGAN